MENRKHHETHINVSILTKALCMKKKAKMVSILSWTGKPSLHGVACCRSRGGCATREASPSVFHRKFSAAPHTRLTQSMQFQTIQAKILQ
jgi:hypothetical protein